MKPLRFLVLMVAVSVVPGCLLRAYGQQEVDPDHFDQAVTKGAPAAKAHAGHKVASSHHRASHARLASQHSGRSHHHAARASA